MRIWSPIWLLAVVLLSACTVSKPAPRDPVSAPSQAVRRPLATKPMPTSDVEFDVKVTAKAPIGPCKLRAVLTTPNGAKARTLVVIVHGSGPMNRDGTVGTAQIYRDLGTGLAARGHATLRFDKRAAVKGCAEKLKHTLTTEVFLSDILQVVKAGTARPEAAGLKLVLFGHSEGATFISELGAADRLAPHAYVLAAGLGRFPIDATVLRQLHVARDKPGLTAADKAKVDKMLADGERLFFAIREKRARPREFYLGAYTGYWRDLMTLTDRSYQTAGKLKAPVLAIQGTEDQNITRDDHLALAEATAAVPGSEAHLLPGIDHLMMLPGEAHVADLWLDTVAAWLDSVTGGGAI